MKNRVFGILVLIACSAQLVAQLPYLNINGSDTTIDKAKYTKYINNHTFTTRTPLLKEDIKKMDKRDRPDLAYEHDWLMTHDPTDGKIHWERLIPVIKQMKAGASKIQTVAPGGSAANKWSERGPNDVGGRVRAMMFDPTDNTNKKVFAGGVGGGLWYNADITSSTSSWVAVNDFWANLAVSCIAYDPTSTITWYVGTGEGFGNVDAIRGAGVWKSTNKGATWTQLTASNTSSFQRILDIAVTNTGRLVVAAFGGLYTSDNGGTSFTRRQSSSYFADIEIAANGDLFAGTRYSGRLYKSTNNGTSWTLITNLGGSPDRIEIACAPSDSNTLYVVSSGGSGSVDVEWFKKSVNGGTSWTTLTIPKYASNITNHFTRGQSWYDLILWVHPTNKNIVVAGGVDLHRTTNGGTAWSPVSYWNSGQSPLPVVHADQHMVLSRPGNNNEVIVGNDGGVYYSSNLGNSSTTAPTFSHRVKNFNITQYYSGALSPTAGSNVMIAGAQDNGTHKLTGSGIGGSTEITGGDGAFCFIDQSNSSVFITSYIRNNWRRSLNSGASFNYLPSDNTGRFINPADYDDNLNILYSAKTSTTIKRITGLSGTYSISDVTVSSLGAIPTHIRVSPYTTSSSTLFVGANSDVYKVTTANSTPTVTKITPTSFPTEAISCIEIGASENELLVTFSSYGGSEVYYTSNGGTGWVNKSGNLPDMPIRWALFNPKDRKEVIVATELGVWSTADITASSPNWAASNNGLANTRVDMLQYRTSDSLIMASTHGRGVFTGRFKAPVSNAPIASFTASKDTICVGESVTYTSTTTNSPTSLSWTMFGGTPNLGSGSPVSTMYNTSGLKSVTLIAANSNGSNSKTQSLVYVMSKPTASISSISPVCISASAFTLTQGSPSGGVYSGTGVSLGMFSPSTAGVGSHTIKYKVTNSAGCSDSATTSVSVINKPNVTASSMSAVCSNSPSITLSNGSPTGGTYGGTGVSSGIFNPSAAGVGTHNLSYIYGSSTCKDTANFSIKVDAAPNVTLGAIGPYCTSSPKDTLTQGNPVFGGIYSGPGVSGTNFTPSIAGAGNHLIKYVATNSNGCKDSATTTVSVSSGISVSVGTVADQCSNSPSLTLSNGSPSGGTYTGTGVTSGMFSSSAAGVGTHQIKYALGTGSCRDSAFFNIKVNAAPTASFASVGPLCTSDTARTLTQGSPSGGVYSGTGVTGGKFSPSSAGAGSHVLQYIVTNTNGCKDTANTTVTVFTGATATATSIPNQCSNSPSLTLTNGSPSGGTYSGTGVTAGVFSPSSAGFGTHSIKYLIGAGSCKDSALFNIVVNAAPSVSLTAVGPFCVSDSDKVLTQGFPNGGTYSGTGVIGNKFSPTSAGIGTHSLKYKVTNGACSDSASVSVQVGNGVTPTLGTFSNVCANASPFTLTGGLPIGGTYSGTGVSSGMFSPAIAGSGIHTISYTHSTACVGTKASSTINVDSVPVLTLSKDTSVCLGSFVQLRVTGAKSYLWTPRFSLSDSTGANPLASPKVNTTYLVTGTNANGCSSSKTVKVVVNSTPTVNAGKNDTACAGIPFQLNATGALAYTWSPPAGLSNRNIANPTATITSSQNYIVMGFDANGCRDFDTILLEVTVAPTSSLDSFSDVCVKSGLVILTSGKPAGGLYSGTSVSGGNFNPKTAGIGTHTISYTVKVGTCSATAIQTIKVISSPTIVWNTKLEFCENENAITPIAKPPGGAFSGNSLNNGKIDPGKLVAGRYTVTYTYSDSSGCSSIDSKEVVVNPNSSIDSIRGLFKAVINRTYNYNLSAVNGSNYLWAVTGGKVLSSRSNLITVKWGKGPKGYLQVIQTNQFGCLDSTNAEVFLAPLSTEEMSYGGGELKLFPNPTRDVLFVKLVNVSGVNNLIFSLVSMDGKIVKTGNLELEGGNKTFEIDLSEVSTGIYFFQTEDDENLIITPVVVNK